MQDLRLVAANERGSHLVLRSVDGEKFVVSIDERLRAAVRGDRSRLAPLDGEGDQDLRPREIQARIRAGASAEQIARSAGVPIDRVRRFEGPVLAEREHIATLAQRSTVRRPGLDIRPMSLGDTLGERLAGLGVDPAGLGWDSWRRDDGRWVVQVAYSHEDRTAVARYTYDLKARSVVADNDEARWLIGEIENRPAQAPFVPRLASAPEPADTLDLAPQAPAAEPVEAAPAASGVPRRPDPTVNRRPPDVTARRPVAPPTPTLPPAPPMRRAPVQMEVPMPTPVPVAPAQPDQPVRTPAARSTGTEGEAAPRAPRTRRAAIPAWDDIVFGARRPE